MAQWSGDKAGRKINGGNAFEPNDAVRASDLNAVVNNSIYAQEYVDGITAEDGSDVATVGTPSVSFDKDKKKFIFHQLKGENGETGAAAGFGTVSATVDANVGTPSVTVTASGSNTAKNFSFAFKNLRGIQGATGREALVMKGYIQAAGTPVLGTAYICSPSEFNRTPVLNEPVNVSFRNTNNNDIYYCIGTINSIVDANTIWVVLTSAYNLRGATGAQGAAATINNSASNKLNFNLSGTTLTITVS